MYSKDVPDKIDIYRTHGTSQDDSISPLRIVDSLISNRNLCYEYLLRKLCKNYEVLGKNLVWIGDFKGGAMWSFNRYQRFILEAHGQCIILIAGLEYV